MAELEPVDFERAKPLGRRVVVRREKAPPLPHGLIAPDSAIAFHRRWTARVLAVGVGVLDPEIKKGMRVLIDPFVGGSKLDRIEQDDMEMFVHEMDIALHVTDEEVDIICQA